MQQSDQTNNKLATGTSDDGESSVEKAFIKSHSLAS